MKGCDEILPIKEINIIWTVEWEDRCVVEVVSCEYTGLVSHEFSCKLTSLFRKEGSC